MSRIERMDKEEFANLEDLGKGFGDVVYKVVLGKGERRGSKEELREGNVEERERDELVGENEVMEDIAWSGTGVREAEEESDEGENEENDDNDDNDEDEVEDEEARKGDHIPL